MRAKFMKNLDKIYIWYDAEGDYLEVDLANHATAIPH